MKKITLILSLFLISNYFAFGQHYLGQTIKSVNLRISPDIDSEIIKKLEAKQSIFIFGIEIENNFYHVIDIANDIEGYLHKDYVKLIKPIARNQGETFTKDNDIEEYNSKVKIYNNTNRKLTLRLNSSIYFFIQYERKEIDISSGYYDILASSSGVIPYSGGDDLISKTAYSWEFYIDTKTYKR